MPISKLHFNPALFTVVKEKSTQHWFAVRNDDTPFGKWNALGKQEINCIPIDQSGYLIEMAGRPMLRNELDTNIFLPMEMFHFDN